MTVLVTEDDKFLASAYKLKLTKQGWDVVVAYNGREAIDYLQSHQPNLILLDLIMPDTDGFTVLEAIHAQPNLSSIPVIVASNLGQKEDVGRAMELGAKDFVVKSETSLDQIVTKIKTLLGQSN
jgi:DNA-binding response OmpR family regulator